LRFLLRAATTARRRHVGTTIRDAWTHSLAGVRQALDADTSADRAVVLRAATSELAATREDVIQAVTTPLELPRKSGITNQHSLFVGVSANSRANLVGRQPSEWDSVGERLRLRENSDGPSPQLCDDPLALSRDAKQVEAATVGDHPLSAEPEQSRSTRAGSASIQFSKCFSSHSVAVLTATGADPAPTFQSCTVGMRRFHAATRNLSQGAVSSLAPRG
jgi:hypothetical protein